MNRLVCMDLDSPSARKRRRPEKAREALLDAAFDEMYLHGFRAAGIEVILASSGVSKGALYHHFGNKQGLGYAVIEERVKPLVRQRYLQPFQESDDPPDALRRMGQRMEDELLKTGIIKRGCPLNNLVQEMSGVEEGFRQRLADVLEEWRDTIADGLRSGQAEGTVNPESDAEEAGTFIVAVLMGAVGFAKNAQDVMPFDACRRVLDTYLETLKPKTATAGG
ncbi:MAG: TetR/AcrR family transcriptional regulator [Planctomycetota bacterium]